MIYMNNIRDVNKQYRSYKNLKILGHDSTEIKPIFLNWDAMGLKLSSDLFKEKSSLNRG